MNMETFWSTIPLHSHLTLQQLKTQYPEAVKKAEDEGWNFANVQFALSGIPNLGPSGATSDQDEADLAERDPDEEIMDADGPTLDGTIMLMAYNGSVDELYTWQTDTWYLWNY